MQQEPKPDERPEPPGYSANLPKSRGHNRIQSFVEGVKESVRGRFTSQQLLVNSGRYLSEQVEQLSFKSIYPK
jgi:hypothetical protein